MTANQYRILLVDHDKDDYVVTRDLLGEAEQVHFELDWVATYREALETIGDDRHDAYLLGYPLDAETGLDLLKAAIDQGCQKPLIVLTGLGSHEIDQQALALGASDYLTKGPQLTAPLLERSILHAISRKQAEKALRDRAALYRLLFQEANDLLLIHPLGNEGQPGYPFTDVNDAACKLLGYSREEFCQLTPLDLIAPEEMVDLPQELVTLTNTHQLLFEKTLIAKNGERIPAELHARVFDWQGIPMVLSVARNITERKATEAQLLRIKDELEQKEELFRNTFEQAAVGIAHVSPQGNFMRLNQRFCEITGYPHAELRTLTFQDITHADDLAKDLTYVQEMLSKQRETYHLEKRYIRKDHSIVWINLTVSLVHLPTGDPDYFISVIEDITDRKAAEAKLGESQRRLTLATTATQQGIWDWDVTNNQLFWDDRMLEIYGISAVDFQGHYAGWKNLIHPDDLTLTEAVLQAAIAGPQDFQAEFRIMRPNGDIHVIEAQALMVRDANGRAIRMTGVNRDISTRKQTELERDRFFNLALDLLFIADQDGILKRVNPAWSDTLGYATQDLVGTSFWHLIHPEDQAVVTEVKARLQQGQDINGLEIRCHAQNHTYRWIAWNAVPFLEENLLYGTGRDISQRKRSEASLVYETLHDGLTGLNNRTYFLQCLDTSIKQSNRRTGYGFAVLFIDLDNFKQINDSLGHLAGDRLLIQVAKILQVLVREVDVVARLGGDEFTILLDDINNLGDILNLAKRIQAHIKAPFHFDNKEVFTSASIGIVLSKPTYQVAADIIRDADIAMYRAKANGKGCYEVFDQAMYTETLRLVELANDLRHAIERQELHLHYQPLISMKFPHPIMGFEVLLRWYHPEKGIIPASEFIPMAEDTGQINEIGAWVLESACQQFQAWQAEGRDLSAVHISVNLSGRQLQEPDFLGILNQILVNTQIPTQNLSLEVTETTLVKDIDKATPILQAIRAHGIAISLDDFGTGFSSLRYLQRFPITVIKIDQSFVKSLDQGDRERSIIQSIITLAKALGFITIAEGIETQQQFEQLQSLGCDIGQGYLFSKPLSRQDLEQQFFVHGNMQAFPIQTRSA